MNFEPYIKYLKIFVIMLWVLAIGGAVYFFLGFSENCPFVGDKCTAEANLSTLATHGQYDLDFSLLKKP